MRAASYGLSLTIHVVLGAAIVWRTLDARSPRPSLPLMVVVPPYQATARPVAPAAPVVDGGISLPVIDPPSIPLPGNPVPLPFGVRPPSGPSLAPVADGVRVVDASLVEEPPTFLAGPVPAYPVLLRQAGVSGRVVLEAVVDTAGRVEPGSITVVESSHAGFVAPAQRSLAATLFRPGRMYGRAVRVLVRIPIDFRLRGDRLSGR